MGLSLSNKHNKGHIVEKALLRIKRVFNVEV